MDKENIRNELGEVYFAFDAFMKKLNKEVSDEYRQKSKNPEKIQELKKTLAQFLSIYQRLGLSPKCDEAIQELQLLINVVKAHQEYLAFKKSRASANKKIIKQK